MRLGEVALPAAVPDDPVDVAAVGRGWPSGGLVAVVKLTSSGGALGVVGVEDGADRLRLGAGVVHVDGAER